MLQSAIFSGNHASTPAVSREAPVAVGRRTALPKVGFAWLAAWGRTLFARDELHGMSSHLRRDIGLGPLD